MARSATVERMTEYERWIQVLLAKAGIWDAAHLFRVLQEESPGLVNDPSTAWRYLWKPPKKRDFGIVTGIARVLDVDPETLDARLAQRRGDMRM